MRAETPDAPSAFWDRVGELWSRATGGGDVAAKPDGAASEWPTARRAPGVDAAAGWFAEQIQEEGIPKFLFLVGGPGAGKSHTASAVISGLQEVNPRSTKLAHRTYRYQTPSRELVLINDATIGADDQSKGALASDLVAALEAGNHLLACVNRGVLVEELAVIPVLPTDPPAARVIVLWLQELSTPSLEGSAGRWSIKTNSQSTTYLKAGILLDGDARVAQLLVVYVDVCSLMEKAPRVHISQLGEDDFDIGAEDYSVEEFTARGLMGPEDTPASSLLTAAIGAIQAVAVEHSDLAFNPVVANLRSLTNTSVRNGVISILRSAEIVSSQRFTYREVWGAIARSVVADATDIVNPEDLRAYLLSLSPGDASGLERFRKMQRLGDLRFSQALVGSLDGSGLARVLNPVTRLTSAVDPVRDAVPGDFDGSPDSGWATPVLDAFAGHVDSGSPLSQLRSVLPADSPFVLALEDFDDELDRAFVLANRDESLRDNERRRMIAWYGAYLLRLYAVSCGIPAFRREIATWTLAWFMSPTLPGDLEEQLHTLLKPPRYPSKGNFTSLIPVFESRTDPVVGEVVHPKVALRTASVDLKTETRSDSLFLRLQEASHESPPIILDFALMREALACDSGHAGITDVSDATSPRLERFRAARLVPGASLESDNYRLVVGTSDFPINVGG